MRQFVRSHPSYKFDSVVSQEINYDLMIAVDEMYVSHARWGRSECLTVCFSERGFLRVPELLPQDYSRSQVNGLHESKFEP